MTNFAEQKLLVSKTLGKHWFLKKNLCELFIIQYFKNMNVHLYCKKKKKVLIAFYEIFVDIKHRKFSYKITIPN